MVKKEYITQVEFAKRNKITHQAVGKWVKTGKLPLKAGKIIMPDAQLVYDEIKKRKINSETLDSNRIVIDIHLHIHFD